MLCKAAFAYFIENCLNDFFHAGGDDFREILDSHLLLLHGSLAADHQHLFAQALELVRQTRSEGELDVLCQSLRYLKLVLYVVCDVLASERDRCVVTHYVSVIDGH